MNWAVSPGKIDVAAGEITMERRVAGRGETTVIKPCPATPDSVAVMLAEPVAWLVTRPELDMRAMLVIEEVQIAESVISLVDPSL